MSSKQQLEQHQTIQNYVTTLFDSLPKIHIIQNSFQFNQSSFQSKEKSNNLISKLIYQNQLYGKKIIQLSDKFTSMYRKDHVFQRKDIEQKIRLIYHKILDKNNYPEIDQMLNQILQNLKKQDHPLIKDLKPQKYQIQVQKLESKPRKSSQFIKLSLPNLQENNQNISSLQPSRKQSIQSKGKTMKNSSNKKKDEQQLTIKKIFKIKNMFQKEETKLRQFFQKIREKINQNKVSILNIPEEKLKYTKKQQKELQNIQDLIKLSTENSIINIQNIFQTVNFIFIDYQRKMKEQKVSQDKFNLYTKQIQRREEVFSYAVSKMIDNITKLKAQMEYKNQKNAKQIIENLLSIGQKFYELYPSNIVLSNLKVPYIQKSHQQLIKKNYGVQVNTFKIEKQIVHNEKKTNFELFKTQIKVQEIILKYQKAIQYKKVIQQKEVIKLLNSIVQIFPEKKTQRNPQMISYEAQLKKIMQINQQKQKELVNQSTKRNKKNEKKISQLQQQLIKNNFQLNLKDQQLKKYHKKTQSLIVQFKKQQERKNQYQKAFSQVSQQISKLKQNTKTQQKDYYEQIQLLKKQCQILKKQNLQLASIKQKSEVELRNIQSITQQQRSIYRQKIILLQRKQQQNLIRQQNLKIQLQKITNEFLKTKDQVKEMGQLYEQKIKKIEQMIENIKLLKQTITFQQSENQELKQLNLTYHQKEQYYIKEIEQKQSELVKIKKQLEISQENANKYKQIGVLNDKDVQILKEEMLKVKNAYQESEQNLEQLRIEMEQIQDQKIEIEAENIKLCRSIDQLRQQSHKLKVTNIQYQKECKELKTFFNNKQQQYKTLKLQYQTIKKLYEALEKDSKSKKEVIIEQDHQLRRISQELIKKKQQDNLDNGKRKLQFQTLKIQLRKKSQQFSKLKEKYQEKIEILQHKNRQLQQFISQKDLLSKISLNHQTQ